MPEYQKILVAVDFSAATEKVCATGADLARRYAAQMAMVHVIEPLIIDPVYDVVPAVPAELQIEQTRQARDELQRLAARYGVLEDRYSVRSGLTKTQILEAAREMAADLILVGSHGRHGVGLLLGSTANAILHGAPCDVLAVRIQDA